LRVLRWQRRQLTLSSWTITSPALSSKWVLAVNTAMCFKLLCTYIKFWSVGNWVDRSEGLSICPGLHLKYLRCPWLLGLTCLSFVCRGWLACAGSTLLFELSRAQCTASASKPGSHRSAHRTCALTPSVLAVVCPLQVCAVGSQCVQQHQEVPAVPADRQLCCPGCVSGWSTRGRAHATQRAAGRTMSPVTGLVHQC
jgi:hypothetical protein